KKLAPSSTSSRAVVQRKQSQYSVIATAAKAKYAGLNGSIWYSIHGGTKRKLGSCFLDACRASAVRRIIRSRQPLSARSRGLSNVIFTRGHFPRKENQKLEKNVHP